MQVMNDGLGSQWKVDSAGTWTASGRPPLQDAVALAGSFGINIKGHSTRALDTIMLQESDIVLVMETGHKESIQVDFPFARKKVHLLSQIVEGIAYDIPDPARSREEAREIISDLVTMIRTGYKNIYRIAESN